MSNFNIRESPPQPVEAPQPSIPQDRPYAIYIQALSNDIIEVLRQYAINWREALDLLSKRDALFSCFEEVRDYLRELDDFLVDLHAQHEDTVTELVQVAREWEELGAIVELYGDMGGWYRVSRDERQRERDATRLVMEALMEQRADIMDEILLVERIMSMQAQWLVWWSDQCVVAEDGILDQMELAEDLMMEMCDLWEERDEWLALL